MPPRSRARDAPSEAQIFKATYSGVPVYEMICKGVAVMRRRSDGWLNATQILKVAGLDKPQRTRVLEREVQKGEHEKVQGGYGKYQGTWVPMERGMGLARQYNVQPLLQPIADFVPASNSPPLAPKHATLPSVKTKRKPGPAEGNVMATRSSRRGAPSGAANVEDAEGEDEHMVDAVAESDPDSRRSSPPASGDGSMTSSPSEASSSSRTPSPIASEAVAMNNVHGSNQNGMDWTRNDMDAVPSGSRGRPPYPESGPLSSYPQPPPQHYPGANYIQPSHSQYPQTGRDSRRYGDIILEYFPNTEHPHQPSSRL
ncbi:hypothetical protein FRC03_004995 [Tulasnella sp. 419]|nr:hypothetical protein FRC03_004995 [Tulasnella sp. 419]